jgi:putative endopeptidase
MRVAHIPLRAILASIAVSLLATPSIAAVDVLNPENFDSSVSPTADFYKHAVGGWQATNPIPPDRASWGAFAEAAHVSELRVQGILESPAVTDAARGSERRKVGDFYAACTDTDGIDARGFAPIRTRLEPLDHLTNATFASTVAELSQDVPGNAPGFGFGSEQDPKNATSVIASVAQGGLTLPTKDYYLDKDARSVALRAAFRIYLLRSFALVGDAPAVAAREAAAVLAIETQLASISKSDDELRDPFANFHPMPLARVQALAPQFDWPTYFATMGVPQSALGRIDVNQPAFMTGFGKLTRSDALADWKSYLRWRVISGAGPAAPKPLRDAAFAFERARYGTKTQEPRSRTCVGASDSALGFAIGKVYVAKYFPPSARARARAEVAAIRASLESDIKTVSWMGAQTRAAALEKLAKLNTKKVGYPDKWIDYSKLRIDRADFLGDVFAANRFRVARDTAKIGKPVDKTDWGLTPQTVNAYYDPSNNEIVIPAGILEKPFFDADADDAVNFGGIGVVIGHEMTHGYDDQGSDYDGDGNLHPIVTKADAARFHAKVACIVDQLDAYKTSVGLHLNGKLDAGEATADLGGLALSYRAMEAGFARAGHPGPLGGLTAEQRYFLSFAQIWRENVRPLAERSQVLGDPHPVSSYRVNGTVSDSTNFDMAFGVQPGDAMYRAPSKRCAIW